ncbi:TRAP transporter small permease [Ruegeria jejuensis]|uniref:TRAP transporter small permease n=1 Tax=Ruegeria jejuensis TaxID=3233338 RepID=UPI00355C1624
MLIAINRLICKIENTLAVSAYTLMTLMILGEIIAREIFGASIFGSTKIAILAAAVAGFFGYAMVTQAGTHLRMSALDNVGPQALRNLIDRHSDLLSCILYLAISLIAVQYVLQSMEFEDKVAVLRIPRWPFQSALVFAFGLSAFKHLVFYIHPESRPVREINPVVEAEQ